MWMCAARWAAAWLLGVSLSHAGALAAKEALPLTVPHIAASVAAQIDPPGAEVHAEWERLMATATQPVVLAQGQASYYANHFHGRRTASGERYDKHALTAAHPTLPFGTEVLVRSLQTGKEVLVRIIDRGPHLKGRIIDLSHAAAEALGMRRQGVAEVQLIEQH